MYRTYFLFEDDVSEIREWFIKFYPYAALLNRLISEKYISKKPELLNFKFYTDGYYQVRNIARDKYVGGTKAYSLDVVLDTNWFSNLSNKEQIQFVWDKAYESLSFACRELPNQELLQATEYAYKKGLELNLRTDYIYLTNQITLFDKKIDAVVHMKFEGSDLVAMLELYKNGNLIYETEIARAYVALDIFRDMIKRIEVDSKQRVVVNMKGSKPRKFEIDESILGMGI